MASRLIELNMRTASTAIREAINSLADGHLIILPTDTVYGVAAHPDHPDAVQKLYDAKQRDAGKPIPLLAAGWKEAERFGARFTPPLQRLAERYWPGALTLVLETRGRTEGIRVPDFELTRQLLREAGGLLRVTSANQSGAPPALNALEAAVALEGWVDVVLDAGVAPGGVASSVVRANDSGGIEVLREGAIPTSELQRNSRQESTQ